MYALTQNYLIEQIERIINNSRFGDELFLTDTKKAATNILQFLSRENITMGNDLQVEMEYTPRNAA